MLPKGLSVPSLKILIIFICFSFVFAVSSYAQEEGLVLQGTKVLTFKTRTVEGSKEGEAVGSTATRDESLRLNISGRAAGTDVDATIISTSTTGIDTASVAEDKISISLRRGSTEAYWGDFTADLGDLEFARIDKVLSGLRLTGNYGNWGFSALASSPKGEAKSIRIYGDETQGPYYLGYAPVVIDSERVRVDGVEQKRGEDYDIDYEAGTVTFRKRTILDTSIINIDFDYRRTPYQHSTYGMRIFGNPMDKLKLGVTYINDSDSLNDARDTRDSMTTDPIDPMSHYIVGVDGSYEFGPALRIESELAFSERNPNLLASSSQETIEQGRAGKLNVYSDIGPLSVATRVKRIGPAFRSVSDADPKQDLWLVGGDVAFSPTDSFHAEGTYDNENYVQSGVRYRNTGAGAKTKYYPLDNLSVAYFFGQLEESNDPVSGDLIDRLTQRNAAEAEYSLGFLRHKLMGSIENRLSRTPSEETTVYSILGYGASTIGIENFSVSGNVELKETEEPSGDVPLTRTYILNLSATPAREYFASLSFNHVDDSKDGATTVTDLSLRADPIREVRTDTKYTITSIKEDFGATPEVVSKQVGSLRIDIRPIRELRLRHTFRPNFTIVRDLGILSYSDNSNQSEITWSPFRQLTTGVIYRVDDMFSLDKEAIALGRREEESSVKSTTLTLKAAPIRIMSVELNYTFKDLFESLLSSTEPVTYDDTMGDSVMFDAAVKTSLSERFSLDTRYSIERIDLNSTNASNEVNSMTQTGSIKGTWNIDDSWSLYASGAYSETMDYLAAGEPLTYSISPGLGFIYRILNMLRIEGSYEYSKSYLGAETEKMLYILKTKYDVNEYVHLTFNLEQEVSYQPDYRVTDFLGNIEIDL